MGTESRSKEYPVSDNRSQTEPQLPAAETDDAEGVSLLTIAWQRKSLLALGIVVMLVLGALYYAQATPVYKSEAQVLVVKRHPDIVTGDATHSSHFEDYIATHRIIMQSPVVVQGAIKLGQLDTLKCLATRTEDLNTTIVKKLTVSRVSRDVAENPNSVLQVAFQGTVPSECGEVVNAILSSYKQFLDDTYQRMSDDSVKLITEARRVLEDDLTKKEAAYRDFRENSPMIWKGKEDANPREERLGQIDAQRSVLMLRRADFEGQLTAIENARKAGHSQEDMVALVSDLSAGKPDAFNPERDRGGSQSTLKTELLPLLLEERTLVEQYGPNHPQVQAIRQRIEATRSFFALPSAAYSKATEQTTPGTAAPQQNLVELYVRYLKRELDRIKVSEEVLETLYHREHEEARRMSRYEIQDADYRHAIARTEALYEGIVKRLQEANIVKDYGGYDARIIAPAGGGKKVSPNPLVVFGGSALLGLLAGIGLVYLAEVTDNRFRTPEEIRRRLGLPLMGHIPCRQPDRAARKRAAAAGMLDATVFAHHQPRSPMSEAYRALRTAVYFSNIGAGHKVLQITSPMAGDGKSTVAANLAVSIAQSGKRTLLVDADLRRPRQHTLVAVPNDVGLAAVIADEAELADAVRESQIRNLWVLPCGPLPPDPAELLTSPRFAELLDVLREQYDFVVVDSAPLLAVTDACVVGPRVDGVLLVVRVSKYGRIVAQRAREILAGLGSKALGVVVNAADVAGPSRYHYAYGYGYHDGYGYGDGNGEGERGLNANGRDRNGSQRNGHAAEKPSDLDARSAAPLS
jgi:polysaccharide biosynthesis transport protein